MNKNQAEITRLLGMGGVAFVLAIVFAMWPQISALLGGPQPLPPAASDTAATTFDYLSWLPVVGPTFADLTLSPLMTLIVTGALAVGPIIVVGGGLAFGFAALDQMAASTKEEPEYQEAVTSLDNQWKEQLKEWKETQPASGVPSHDRPQRFAVAAASLFMLMALFAGYMLAGLFYPDGTVVRGNEIISAGRSWGLSLMLLVGVSVLAYFRPKTLAAIEGEREAGIPWTMIFSLLLGVLVLGIGGALILMLQQGG
ncbi:MAG TPA: hypothetical protein VLL52_05200 [Anaerolineae bacterium]|nr:hypothetical protein [Anaerolineae bacterium]